MKFVLLFSSMILAIVGQMFLKTGIMKSTLSPNIHSVINTLFQPFVLIGFIAYGASSIFWLFVLQRFPLSVAYPALSITYIVIVFLSFYFLKEPITSAKLAGVAFIILGVYLLFR